MCRCFLPDVSEKLSISIQMTRKAEWSNRVGLGEKCTFPVCFSRRQTEEHGGLCENYMAIYQWQNEALLNTRMEEGSCKESGSLLVVSYSS